MTPRARIVLIDDNQLLVRTLRELLESEGYDVLTCTDGDRAYEFVREHRPELILLDILLGANTTGWSILELLTFDADTRQIPVLVLTGTVGEIEHLSVLPLFGITVIAKPFDLDLLLERVRAALAGRAACP